MANPTSFYFPGCNAEEIKVIRKKLANLAARFGYNGSPGRLLEAIAREELELRPACRPLQSSPAFAEALAMHLSAVVERGIGPATIATLLAGAAAEVVGDIAPLRIYRLLSPEDDKPLLVIIENTEEERIALAPSDISTLRALICALNEFAPPQAGEAYIAPAQTADGRLISRKEEKK